MLSYKYGFNDGNFCLPTGDSMKKVMKTIGTTKIPLEDGVVFIIYISIRNYMYFRKNIKYYPF